MTSGFRTAALADTSAASTASAFPAGAGCNGGSGFRSARLPASVSVAPESSGTPVPLRGCCASPRYLASDSPGSTTISSAYLHPSAVLRLGLLGFRLGRRRRRDGPRCAARARNTWIQASRGPWDGGGARGGHPRRSRSRSSLRRANCSGAASGAGAGWAAAQAGAAGASADGSGAGSSAGVRSKASPRAMAAERPWEPVLFPS
jgi:hypothetical protein